jgi:REP element-mobilizing transposase RayT
MNQFSFKSFYRRNLPHVQPEGATFFITSRLAGSLPADVLEKLHQEKEAMERELDKITDKKERAQKADLESLRFFGLWGDALDKFCTDVKFLADARVADLVAESLHYRDHKVYDLISYSIMPNHKHVVFTPLEESNGKYFSLSKIMHSLKRHTAREANLILGREGEFWQHENYDHYIRDAAELERIVKYVLYNPVKAGLVDDWRKWEWSYCKFNM